MEYFRNSMGPVGECLSDSRIDERNVDDALVDGSTCAQRHVLTGQLRLQLLRNQGHRQAKFRVPLFSDVKVARLTH